MVARGIFLDVMRIVKFHHRGYLDSFAYDQYMRVIRARYLLDRYDFQVSGVRDGEGYTVDDNFEPEEVSDPRRQIRRIDPDFIAGSGSMYDVTGRVNRVFDIACNALRREDELSLSFCLEAYRRLLIDDGFRLPPVNLPCMRGRHATYTAWAAKVRGV